MTRRRGRVVGVVTAVAGAGCGGESPVTPDDPLPPDAVVDELVTWDPARWEATHHPLGRGRVVAANVRHLPGSVELRLPAGTFDGAELRSVARLTHGVVEGRLRASGAPGSLTGFFLYEGRARRNDEVDVELVGGTRTILFTVWQEDAQVFHRSATLDFDPAAGFHDYRITWTEDRVEWRVDGRLLASADGLSLGVDLHLYVNAWWPTWREGGPAATDAAVVVARLVT